MIALIKIFKESAAQALQQLWGNRLRTFLSLLGITIGIWCVIMVLSAVDSMEVNIRQSFDKLGDDVIYVDRFSWAEDPNANYWKWMRRPNPSYQDYKAIKKKVSSARMVAFTSFIGSKKLEYRSSNVEGAFTIAVTNDYAKIFNLDFEAGRFFTEMEYNTGRNQVILGNKVAKELFGDISPLGKRVKFMGRKCDVIGVLKESGKDLINPLNFDNSVLMSYELAKKLAGVKNNITRRTSINVKAKKGISLEQLQDDVTGVLRANRRLKPSTESNFALNTLSIISDAMDGVFGTLRQVGIIIGAFSIIVGMFSVANIMFVSVKERTNIIGVKKALGAKNFVILLEFMIESVILCLLGGALGLLFVWILTYAVTQLFGFVVFLSTKNLMIGIIASTLTGIIAGLIPALMAAKMDPVEAIRQR